MIPELEQLREALPRLKELLLNGDYRDIADITKMFIFGIHPIMIRQILDQTVPAMYGTLFETNAYVGKTEATVEFGKAIVLIDSIAYSLAYQQPQESVFSVSAQKP